MKDKWCLDKSVGQTENDLERAFVKMAELRLTDWPMFFVQGVSMREQSAKVAATQAMPQASTRFFYVFLPAGNYEYSRLSWPPKATGYKQD